MTRDRDNKHELDQTLAATPATTVDATVDTASDAATRPSQAGVPLRYRLETELGRGGMGEVLSARDEQIGRSVAIKRLRSAPTPETEARFLREARIQGRLEHPAIVPVHELGRDDRGQPYFAMKQLAGKTLAEVLDEPEEKRGFTRSQLLRALIDVCLAIQFAHERGVVHRDLKPSNIMLGDYGEVYVLDWGIARVLAESESNRFGDIESYGEVGQTLDGQLLGTPGYMSPEQIQGDAIDARADVFALGCILFEVLAGAPMLPRGKEALAATIAGVPDERRRPSRRRAEIAPELDELCVAATHLARTDRLATARGLADGIQHHLDGDRDVALRRRVADAELVAANDAMARDDRRSAFSAASRALALHPEAKEPAQLVGRLMLEVPAKVPPEVDAEVEDIERAALTSTATQGNYSLLVVFAFLPILFFGGFDDPWYLFALPVVGFFAWFGSWLQLRRGLHWGIRLSMIANMGVVAVFSRLCSPFLVAPALGIVIATLFALHRASGRVIYVGVGFTLAILGPWFLELAGVMSPTIRFSDTEMILDPSDSFVRSDVLLPMFGLYVIATITVSILMARSLANVHHDSQRRLQLQAWQLRQLVPEPR